MESKSESAVFSLAPQEIPTAPVRPSGFVALLLGLLSSVVLLSTTLILIPLVTLVVGLFALRPSSEGPPVGRRAAVLGILLAVFFACWSVVASRVRTQQLSDNAERFGHEWMQLTSLGEWEMAMELTKSPAGRQSPQMPLKAYYQNSETCSEQLDEFLDRTAIMRIQDAGRDADWQLAESPQIYDDMGALCVQVRYVDRNQNSSDGVRLELQRMWDSEAGVGEWRVRDFGPYDKNAP
ncbi:hypothetical protein [Roseimaritima sediminicola]|uniref:hypothetical protein n=1 Tax=Roseimaritima sediminicola TaxID=2662066 RepID=UPI0012984750|nr:hypothetical protein [Roseimaritima sediminicola]